MSFLLSFRQTYDASFMEKFLFKVVKQGPIPKHCAIILDGNRRFSRRFLSGDLFKGYQMAYVGFIKAAHMLLDCGITEMTVYVFSQENYKRPEEEVKYVMKVLMEGLLEVEKDLEYINEVGICFEALGNWESIPYDGIPETIARLMLKTKGNSNLKINMALGYSGRDEIVRCANAVVHGLEDGIIFQEDLNEKLVENVLTLGNTSPVDLLIRTSGVTRLSDFLLWSTNDNTCIEFVDVTWPEFKLSHFMQAIISYYKQHIFAGLKSCDSEITMQNQRVLAFVDQFKARKWETVEDLANKSQSTLRLCNILH